MKRGAWFGRIVVFALCMALLLPVGVPVGAVQEDPVYLRPIAGGIVQVAMSRDHIAALRSDGTVAATGNNDWGQCDVDKWSRVVRIWAGPGVTLGLTDTGELLSTTKTIGNWKNIVDVDVATVSKGNMTIVVGLKGDGTAVSMGLNNRGAVPLTQDVCNVTGWTEVVQVLVYEGIYGLRSDGTVLEAGFGDVTQDNPVSGWSGVCRLAKSLDGVFGITEEGKVLAQSVSFGCETWENVVKLIPGGPGCVYGLTADGRLLSGGAGAVNCGGLYQLTDAAAGANQVAALQENGNVTFSPNAVGVDLNRWRNAESLVYVPGSSAVAALKKDGSVVSATLENMAVPGGCDGWTGVARLFCGGELWLGLKEDGTMVCSAPDMDLTGLTKGIEDTRPKEQPVSLVGAGLFYSIYVRSDGSVSGAGRNSMGCLDVESWTDIIAVDAATHTVGLRSNGTVLAVGPNGSGQCNVSQWENIVDISAGNINTVGLTAQGTVVAVGSNEYGQLNIVGRQGIVDVAAGGSTLYAVTNKGAVYCNGNNFHGQGNVSNWTGIVAISAGVSHVVGLRADGTVVATGSNENGQCNVSDWTDIVAVAAGSTHTVGLKANGTLVVAGSNAFGQANVGGWSDVIAISAGAYHTLALTAGGQVLAAGSNEYGQCDVTY